MKNGILKIAEIGFFLGITGASIFGFVKSAENYSNNLKSYNEMYSSDAVTEYIQDDLDEINSQYGDLSNLDTPELVEYRQKVKNLRENSASKIYGEEFDNAKKNKNIIAPIAISSSAIGALLGLACLIAEAYLRSDTLIGVSNDVKEEISESRFLAKIARQLENVEDIRKNFVLENIYKFENKICFKVGEDASLTKTCFVYNIDPSKSNLKDEHAYNFLDFNDEVDKADKKYLLDIIKENQPVFVGNEDDAYNYIYAQFFDQVKIDDLDEKE